MPPVTFRPHWASWCYPLRRIDLRGRSLSQSDVLDVAQLLTNPWQDPQFFLAVILPLASP